MSSSSIKATTARSLRLPNLTFEQKFTIVIVGMITYAILLFRLMFLSIDVNHELVITHLSYKQHFKFVKDLVDYAEGNHVLPDGRYFELTQGPLLEATQHFEGDYTDEDRIVQDDQMHEKLQMVVLSIHRAISDDGRFKQEHHYQELIRMIQDNERDIDTHREMYNIEAERYNKIRSGFLYSLHRWLSSPYMLLGPRGKVGSSQ